LPPPTTPPPLVERLAVWLATLVCLFFVSSLVDVSMLPAASNRAARPPAHDALMIVRVSDGKAPLDGVRVRIVGFAGDRARRLGEATTEAGRVAFEDLPHGPTWIIAEKEGLTRASKLVELAEDKEVSLALAVAEQFEVVVVDASQRPIQNAKVVVYDADPLPYAVWSDPTGLASFGGLGAGPYSVEAIAQGFGRKLVREVTIGDSPLFLKLEREAGLEIAVTDPQGKPADKATVLVAGSGLWPARSAVTDATGRVKIAGLARGFYEARAERGSQVSEPGIGVMLEAGEHRELEVRLVEGTFVRVVVSDGEGEPLVPIAKADVALVEGGLSSFPLYGRTDGKGQVKLGPIVGGDASVSAQAAGFVPKSAVPVPQGSAEVRVALVRGGTVAGRAVDDRGFPVEGVSLEVIGTGLDGMPIADNSASVGFRRDHFAFAMAGPAPLVPAGELGVMPVVPDVPLGFGLGVSSLSSRARGGVEPWVGRRDGMFELAPVTPGRIQLYARHPAYVDALSAAFDLAPGGRKQVDVVMRRGGALAGRVLEQNRLSVPAARIELIAVDGTSLRITYAGEDGGFAFAAVPEDVVVAVARAEEPETIVEKMTIAVEPDRRREIEIVLPEKREPVAFRVVDDRGFAIDRAEIHASSLEPKVALTKTVFSDERGLATATSARGLPLRVTVRRRGHAPLVTQIERAPAELSLSLGREIALEGEVHSRDGYLADAAIVLLTPTGDRHAKTDASGRFRLAELAPGSARMMVTKEGYGFDERTVNLEPDGYGRVSLGRIELERGGSVEGVVLDGRGDPVAGARVAAGRVPTYLPLGPLPPGVAHTDGLGRFVLKDLEPGATSIEAFKAGWGRSALENVEVRARDSVREIRITLSKEANAANASAAPASLAVTLSETNSRHGIAVMLAHVPYGGEAQRAGLLAGDQLMTVDGLPVRSLEHARQKLDGPPSQDMVLELYRPKLGRFKVRVCREKLRG
jgi:hypothetical protein